MPMTWDQLLSDKRCPRREGEPPAPAAPEPFRSPFEADYDRIIFSTPFRRLARKTQVHPLALNAHVHTRLTHSIEVASVGRSLANRLAEFLARRNELPAPSAPRDLIWIVQAACLAHDIGNPPFGHAGEYAIREWVRMHPAEVFGDPPDAARPCVREDWALFEGNAQGFRLAARADNPQTGYLRVTFATLGAMIKYPWDSGDPRARQLGKCNAFSTEKRLFALMAEHTGMLGPGGIVARHPLSFLSEAADDICYRILDLEDAFDMGILQEAPVRGIYQMMVNEPMPGAPLPVVRGRAIAHLIQAMWDVFERDYDAIMRGERARDLKSGLNPRLAEAMAKIKTLYSEIFADPSKVAAELGAYKALGRIIKALCQAARQMVERRNFERAGFLAQRCLELAWGKTYAATNQHQPYEWWLHQVMDYVSGLTDDYARQLSREIEGT